MVLLIIFRCYNTKWVLYHGVSFSDRLEIGQSYVAKKVKIAIRPAQEEVMTVHSQLDESCELHKAIEGCCHIVIPAFIYIA